MNDMRAVIVPKSDQINADDMLGGPMTITITGVTIKPGTEQPVSIAFEGDNNKPYKPCKSMARVMVQCWGHDANQYVGRSMTLYCDPKVTWGGMAVGGIRISHMTDINGTQIMALTATKGSKKPFTVQPLAIQKDTAPAPTLAEWFKALDAELALVETDADLDAIKARQDVQNMLADDGRPKARDKLRNMLDAAIQRTTPAEDPPEMDGEAEPVDNAPEHEAA